MAAAATPLMTQGNYPTSYPAPPPGQYAQYPVPSYGSPPWGADPAYPAAAYGYGAPAPQKHPGLGIISVILAGLSGVGLIVTMVVAVMAAANDPAIFENEQAPATVALGACVILGAFLSLVGVGLGIGGLTDRNRRKVFAVVGLAVNAVVILIVVGLMALGAAAK